jgi:SAM-dependent methyltransferase
MPSDRRFRSTVDHYLTGRPPYAARLIHRVADIAGLQPCHDVLDLGCGPGQLARAFAPLARQVVAMDPEPEMLRVAEEASRGIANIRFVPGGSDDLSPRLGRFRLVVMGRSFHWMDRAETLRRLDGLIEPDGAVVHFDTEAAELPENDWMARYRVIHRHYTGDDPQRRSHRDAFWRRHESFFLQSAFSAVEGCSVFERRQIAAASLIDRVLSMSSSSPDRLGPRAAELKRDMAALVREIAPDGRLAEVVVSNALIGRRPGQVWSTPAGSA